MNPLLPIFTKLLKYLVNFAFRGIWVKNTLPNFYKATKFFFFFFSIGQASSTLWKWNWNLLNFLSFTFILGQCDTLDNLRSICTIQNLQRSYIPQTNNWERTLKPVQLALVHTRVGIFIEFFFRYYWTSVLELFSVYSSIENSVLNIFNIQ